MSPDGFCGCRGKGSPRSSESPQCVRVQLFTLGGHGDTSGSPALGKPRGNVQVLGLSKAEKPSVACTAQF